MFDFDYQLEGGDWDIGEENWSIEDDIPDSTENSSMVTTVDSCADSTMLSQEHLVENIDNVICQVSFGSHIDDLYDPSINSAQDDLAHHFEEATNARTTDDLEYHLDKVEEARRTENFWKDAKWNAEIESKKHEISIDGINKQWEIMDKYQKELEEICKK